MGAVPENCPKLLKILTDIGAEHLLHHFLDQGDDDSSLSILSQIGIKKLWKWYRLQEDLAFKFEEQCRLESRTIDPGHERWLKAWLILRSCGRGTRPFVAAVMEKLHDRVVKEVKKKILEYKDEIEDSDWKIPDKSDFDFRPAEIKIDSFQADGCAVAHKPHHLEAKKHEPCLLSKKNTAGALQNEARYLRSASLVMLSQEDSPAGKATRFLMCETFTLNINFLHPFTVRKEADGVCYTAVYCACKPGQAPHLVNEFIRQSDSPPLSPPATSIIASGEEFLFWTIFKANPSAAFCSEKSHTLHGGDSVTFLGDSDMLPTGIELGKRYCVLQHTSKTKSSTMSFGIGIPILPTCEFNHVGACAKISPHLMICRPQCPIGLFCESARNYHSKKECPEFDKMWKGIKKLQISTDFGEFAKFFCSLTQEELSIFGPSEERSPELLFNMIQTCKAFQAKEFSDLFCLSDCLTSQLTGLLNDIKEQANTVKSMRNRMCHGNFHSLEEADFSNLTSSSRILMQRIQNVATLMYDAIECQGEVSLTFKDVLKTAMEQYNDVFEDDNKTFPPRMCVLNRHMASGLLTEDEKAHRNQMILEFECERRHQLEQDQIKMMKIKNLEERLMSRERLKSIEQSRYRRLPICLRSDIYSQISSSTQIGECSGQGSVYTINYNGQDLVAKIYKDAGPAWRRELNSLTALYHPNIVLVKYAIYETFNSRADIDKQEPIGYVMERMSCSLDYFARKETMSPELIIKILHQVAEALEFIHACGIAHLDIKPANILLDDTHQIAKLCDFGCSHFTQAMLTSTLTSSDNRGTIYFKAPEIIPGNPDGWEPMQADVYSFGVTLFCLLCPNATIEQLRVCDWDQFTKWPSAVTELGRKCTSQKDARPSMHYVCATLADIMAVPNDVHQQRIPLPESCAANTNSIDSECLISNMNFGQLIEGKSLSQLKTLLSTADLKKARFSAKALKDSGCTIFELRSAGFSASDLIAAECSISDLRLSGFEALQLKNANCNADMLKNSGFTAADLRIAGFDAKSLLDCRCSIPELKLGGFAASQLKEANCDLRSCLAGGYDSDSLISAGFADKEVISIQRTAAEYVRQSKVELFDAAIESMITSESITAVEYYLIIDRAEVNVIGCKGGSMLHFASMCGHLELVFLLLAFGADVNVRTRSESGQSAEKTPLIEAAISGILSVVQVLFQNNADVSLRDFRGYTALDHAIQNKNHDVVQFLKNAAVLDPMACTSKAEVSRKIELLRQNVEIGQPLSDLKKIYSVQELNEAGCTARQLKEAGFLATELVDVFTALALKDAGFNAKELREGGFGPRCLKYAAKFSTGELKEGEFTARELRAVMIPLKSLVSAGYDVDQLLRCENQVSVSMLMNVGFRDLKQLKKAHLTVPELAPHFGCRELLLEGYTMMELTTGFSVHHLKNIGFFTLKQLHDGGLGVEELCNDFSIRELHSLFSILELRKGISVADLKKDGFSAVELQEGGLNARDLCPDFDFQDLLSLFSITQLREGYKGVRSTQPSLFNAFALHLKNAQSFSARQFKEAGFHVEELVPAVFHFSSESCIRLIGANYGIVELKCRGFEAGHLKDAGCNVVDLKNAGFTVSNLWDAGFGWQSLFEVGFDAQSLIGAGFRASHVTLGMDKLKISKSECSLQDLKSWGLTPAALFRFHYVACELKLAGFGPLDLKKSRVSARDIRLCGFSAQQLKDLDVPFLLEAYSVSELRRMKFSAADLKVAGVEIRSMIDGHFTPESLEGLFDAESILQEHQRLRSTLERMLHTNIYEASVRGLYDDVANHICLDKKVVFRRDRHQCSPLHYAAKHGHLDIVGLLLDSSAEIDSKDERQKTPLMFATEEGHLEIVRMLVNSGANLRIANKEALTAVDIARNRMHLRVSGRQVSEFLTTCVQDVVILQTNMNNDETLPAKHAVQLKELNIIQAVEKGLVDLVRAHLFIDPNRVNDKGVLNITPLHTAVKYGHCAIAHRLIASGADIDAPEMQTLNTPLMMAVQRTGLLEKNGLEIVRILIESGADVHLKNNEGKTAFDLASSSNREFLRQHGARNPLRIEDKNAAKRRIAGNSNILAAASENSASKVADFLTVDVLLSNYQDWRCNTPLNEACAKGHLGIVQLLLDAKSDVNVKGPLEYTPLHTAAANGHSKVVKRLLRSSAAVDVFNLHNMTPLMCAAREGHVEVAKLLIEYQADVSLRSRVGETALSWAMHFSKSDIVELLRSIQTPATVSAPNVEPAP